MKKFSFIKNAMMASAIAISTLTSPLAALTDAEIETAVRDTFYNVPGAADVIRGLPTARWNMLKGYLEADYYGHVAIGSGETRVHAAQIAAGLAPKYWGSLFQSFYSHTGYDIPQYITDGKLQNWIPEILSGLEEEGDWRNFFTFLGSDVKKIDRSETFKLLSSGNVLFENWIDYMSAAKYLTNVTPSKELSIIRGLLGGKIDESESPLLTRGITAFNNERPEKWADFDARMSNLFPGFEGWLSTELHELGITVDKGELKKIIYITFAEKFSGKLDLESDFVVGTSDRNFINREKFKPVVDEVVKHFRGLVSRPSAAAVAEEE